MTFKELRVHMVEECPGILLECSNCELSIFRKDCSTHDCIKGLKTELKGVNSELL